MPLRTRPPTRQSIGQTGPQGEFNSRGLVPSDGESLYMGSERIVIESCCINSSQRELGFGE